MRIAAISDIHGNLPALEAVLDDIRRCGVDLTVNLGDIVSGPLWPAETGARLMALALPTIRGNHERQLLTLPRERMSPADAYAAERLSEAQRAWLASLPVALQLAPDVLCCHGTPDSDLDYWLETVTPGFERGGAPGIRSARADEARARLGSQRDASASLRLCGHTHVPRALDLGAEGLVLNPGSVGLQAYDDARPHPHVVENGSPHARWALAERVGTRWQVELHAVVYDWESAARQAEVNGRPDWADALRSGRVGRFEAHATGTPTASVP
ncbi:MAG TPA: metallophosphoesterase [Burkholderiaceae bacterium]|nr:metallophosphoesterase [Burkholderiaceae bacterium]